MSQLIRIARWQVGDGYKMAISLLNEGRIGIGAQMVLPLTLKNATPAPA